MVSQLWHYWYFWARVERPCPLHFRMIWRPLCQEGMEATGEGALRVGSGGPIQEPSSQLFCLFSCKKEPEQPGGACPQEWTCMSLPARLAALPLLASTLQRCCPILCSFVQWGGVAFGIAELAHRRKLAGIGSSCWRREPLGLMHLPWEIYRTTFVLFKISRIFSI